MQRYETASVNTPGLLKVVMQLLNFNIHMHSAFVSHAYNHILESFFTMIFSYS